MKYAEEEGKNKMAADPPGYKKERKKRRIPLLYKGKEYRGSGWEVEGL